MKIECCICCEEFTASEKILTPKCGHLFHELCVNPWLNQNPSCPQCRLAVTREDCHYVHLTAAETSRRSSIFNSSLCENYRQLQETLLSQQEINIKEIENLTKEIKRLKAENEKLKADMQMEKLKREIETLRIENMKLKSEVNKFLAQHGSNQIGGNQTSRQLNRQQSLDSWKNVQSVVAKAWKKN